MTVPQRVTLLLNALTLAFALSAQAQNTTRLSADSRWLRVVRNSDLTAYIDRESINRVGSERVEVWNLWEFLRPQGDKDAQFDTVMFRWELDCPERRLKPSAANYYLRNRHVRSESLELEGWQSPPPQSTGEILLLEACNLAAGQPVDSVP
jgi:hypothetical protein